MDTRNNRMVKCLRINKVTLSATIRVNVNDLRIITDAVDCMADKHKANLLNLSPDKEETKKLANYNAIKENLDDFKLLNAKVGFCCLVFGSACQGSWFF
jgi:hypothetical protein